MPMQMPPSSAPSMLPMPPSTTITNAISTKLRPTVGETDQRGAGGEGNEEDARNWNAHELRRLAVLNGGTDRLAEVGRLQHEAQPERAGDRNGEADQQFGLGIEWAEGERTPSE